MIIKLSNLIPKLLYKLCFYYIFPNLDINVFYSQICLVEVYNLMGTRMVSNTKHFPPGNTNQNMLEFFYQSLLQLYPRIQVVVFPKMIFKLMYLFCIIISLITTLTLPI